MTTYQVLIVDDEHDILESVQMVLESGGYKVKSVDNGKQVLKLLQKEKFDLVLLDILMPEMSGNQVAEEIRKNPKTKNQKLAFLTVVTVGEQGKMVIQDLKPMDYIQKPFGIADFRKRIKKILGLKHESHRSH